MEVKYGEEKREIDFSGKITGLLKIMEIQQEIAVVKVNGKVTPENEELSGNEEVEIIRVVYGG